MGRIKKSKERKIGIGGVRKTAPPNPNLRFSFKLFDLADPHVCPENFAEGYVRALMERLKGLSTWTVNEFVGNSDKSVRNHVITWEKTSRPDGFDLPEQYEAYRPFQFSISANERGRVHGLLIDDTFHLIWLDENHNLYAGSR